MESLIDYCTSEKNTEDYWDLILEICEEYGSKDPKACLKAITKRIFQKNPIISMRAIVLLDACSKNCGNIFNREVASREIIQLIKSRFSTLSHEASVKLTEVFEKWSNEFKSDKSLSLAADLYRWVQAEHYGIIHDLDKCRKVAQTDAIRIAQQKAKEDADLTAAIALSIADAKGANPSGGGQSRGQKNVSFKVSEGPAKSATGSASGLYPGLPASSATSRSVVEGSRRASTPVKGRVRALYDFEAAEDNELSFKAGELILLLDDSDENWWRGSNHLGEGLFPAQFVKPETDAGQEKAVVVGDSQSRAAEPAPATVLDMHKLDECLRLISSVDVTGECHRDPPELAGLETVCLSMRPLVDPQLNAVDRQLLRMSDIKDRLESALRLYHDLIAKQNATAAAGGYGYYYPTVSTTGAVAGGGAAATGGGYPMQPMPSYPMPSDYGQTGYRPGYPYGVPAGVPTYPGTSLAAPAPGPQTTTTTASAAGTGGQPVEQMGYYGHVPSQSVLGGGVYGQPGAYPSHGVPQSMPGEVDPRQMTRQYYGYYSTATPAAATGTPGDPSVNQYWYSATNQFPNRQGGSGAVSPGGGSAVFQPHGGVG